MSKLGTFGDYPKESLQSAEAALLTAWRSLDRYHKDLVLVGGLAVHYLTKRDAAGGAPGAVTMDVDSASASAPISQPIPSSAIPTNSAAAF